MNTQSAKPNKLSHLVRTTHLYEIFLNTQNMHKHYKKSAKSFIPQLLVLAFLLPHSFIPPYICVCAVCPHTHPGVHIYFFWTIGKLVAAVMLLYPQRVHCIFSNKKFIYITKLNLKMIQYCLLNYRPHTNSDNYPNNDL